MKSHPTASERDKIQKHASGKILRNLFATGLTRAATVLLGILASVLVARYLGPTSYGYFITLFALVTIVDATAESALVPITVRDISQQPARTDTWAASATVLRLGFAALGTVGYFVFVYFARYPPEVKAAASIAPCMLLVNAFRMPIAIFRAKLVMHYEFITTLAARLVDVVLILGLMYYGGKLSHFFMARVASALLYVVMAWIFARSFLRFRFVLSAPTIWHLLVQSIPMGLSLLLCMVQLKVDVLMVSSLVGPAYGGLYGAVAQLPEYSVLVSDVFMTTALPIIARYHAQSDRDNFQLVYQRTFDILMMIIIPAAVVVALIPHKVILLLFGSKFVAAAPALRVLMLVNVLAYFDTAGGMVTIALNRQKTLVWIEVVVVAVYLTLNLFFIPRWNYMGAAVARVLTTVLGSFLAYHIIIRGSGLSLRVNNLMKVILCSGVMAGIILLLLPVHSLLAIAAGGIFYIAAVWFICGIPSLKFDRS